MNQDIFELLSETIPFHFLSREERQTLSSAMEVRDFPGGTKILKAGQKSGDLYLVASGAVSTYRLDAAGEPRRDVVNVIKRGRYFGERSALFGTPYPCSFKAMKDTRCYILNRDTFLDLVTHSRAFAQSLGNILRDQQGIFSAFEIFQVELMKMVTAGTGTIRQLIPFYRELKPALHPGLNKDEIDTGALRYAIRRLPDNITGTFSLFLTDDLPSEFLEPDLLFQVIESPARRRNTWQMVAGQNMILMRSGLSDLLDLITCLCLVAVEARKIRMRLHNPKLVLKLQELLSQADRETSSCLAQKLPFSPREIRGLCEIWPHDLISRLNQIVSHRESFSIRIRRQIHNYNTRRTELWTRQISDAARQLLGADPGDLSPDWDVHIISSNAHSVTNCLNPWFSEHRGDLEDWAEATKHPVLKTPGLSDYDRLYALARDYFRANGSESFLHREASAGILRLNETASTGIQVQLIDGTKIGTHPVDPGIQRGAGDRKILIVNIDYAFGEQAEPVLRNLIMLFSRNLRSINILGKAGSLVGRRGDVLVPSGFVEQTSDQFMSLNSSAPISRLESFVPGREVHAGGMLTVSGTLLQNRTMLEFYKQVWGCVGLEMEGVYYYRQCEKARQLGVLPESVELRYLYYVSDTPLKTGASLSAPLAAGEGIPPLYGITRAILSAIFG